MIMARVALRGGYWPLDPSKLTSMFSIALGQRCDALEACSLLLPRGALQWCFSRCARRWTCTSGWPRLLMVHQSSSLLKIVSWTTAISGQAALVLACWANTLNLLIVSTPLQFVCSTHDGRAQAQREPFEGLSPSAYLSQGESAWPLASTCFIVYCSCLHCTEKMGLARPLPSFSLKSSICGTVGMVYLFFREGWKKPRALMSRYIHLCFFRVCSSPLGLVTPLFHCRPLMSSPTCSS